MLKPFLQLKADGIYELLIEGIISGMEWWGDEFTPEMVREELAKAGGNPIRIIINSPGGEVFAGAAIYNALLQYEGRKTVRVDGVAASMASVIAMVGEDIQMSPGSTMMIHRPMVGAYGNVKDLNKAIDVLTALEETILPIYEDRTGLSKEEVFTLLDEETWMSPEKAVELGFADSVVVVEKVEQAEASAFEKIKAMLSNEQFAFSMGATHKSLEHYVAETEAPNEEEVTPVNPEEELAEEVVETPATPVEDVPAEEVVETPETEEVETPATDEEEVTEPPLSEIKPVAKKKEINKMPKPETIATDTVVDAPLANPTEATNPSDSAITMREFKTGFVEMLSKAYNGNKADATAEAERLGAVMVIDGTTGDPLFGGEILSRDIRESYTNLGRVGALVNRIDIEGAETFKQLVETAGAGFRPVALGAVKQEDQPVWTPVTFEPHEFALIVAWLDGVQKRSPIAIYNQIVRYIAKEYARLEDKIILTWEGGTFGGEVFPQTGLVPILTDEGRITLVASYDAADVLVAIADAYGEIESDGDIVLVANRATWARLAVTLDANENPIFKVVGEQVQVGALGTFRVVLSSELSNGDVVVGVYEDYNIVTRGQLATLFSREATVGELNLFTQDASALRADVDITGGPVVVESFQLLQFEDESS
jgi:ATP-dependent Clp protease protease subunit